jgi:hypothetical protein
LKQIGGYFELEIPNNCSSWHPNAMALNSARNCYMYILKGRNPAKVFLPNYICNSMLQPLDELNIRYDFYSINSQLQLANKQSIGKKDLLLYVNYFGIMSDYCKTLFEQYGENLVIDNSQAFFETPLQGIDTFYSPRKFFGVSDGGYLCTNLESSETLDQDHSIERVRHLVGRIENSATDFYSDYRDSEASLVNQPIKQMSILTSRILQSVDYEKAKLTRERNFLFLHSALKESNELDLNFDYLNGPMIYPYLSKNTTLRQALISQQVFVAKYWQEVLTRDTASQLEKELVECLIPLPIDQRYNLDDMRKVLEVIHKQRS